MFVNVDADLQGVLVLNHGVQDSDFPNECTISDTWDDFNRPAFRIHCPFAAKGSVRWFSAESSYRPQYARTRDAWQNSTGNDVCHTIAATAYAW